MGLLEGSMLLAGRHVAGEEYRSGCSGESVRGVVSHAGTGMLRELAELTGLSARVTARRWSARS
jgi:hypothetical protein